jgi:hypothetical protein
MTAFSRETLLLFQELLSGMSVHVGHPDFEERVAVLITAKREVASALAAVDESSHTVAD